MKLLASIFLIFTVLLSTVGVSVNTHFCKKEGVITTFFMDSGECTCEIQTTKAEAHSCCHKPIVETKPIKGCCQDETEFFQLEFDYTNQLNEESLTPELIYTAALVYNFVYPVAGLGPNGVRKFEHYIPPIPDRDIPVLVQSFLI